MINNPEITWKMNSELPDDNHRQQFNTIIHEDENVSQFNSTTPSTTHSRFDHTAQSEMTGGNQAMTEHNVSSPTSNSVLVQHPDCHLIENNVHSNTKQNGFGPTSSPLQQNRGILNKGNEKATIAKTKKPFLKKGSRKEPSSLQRANKEVLKKGMRFSNDGKGCDSSTQNDGSNKQKTLAYLEQMQEQQGGHLGQSPWWR